MKKLLMLSCLASLTACAQPQSLWAPCPEYPDDCSTSETQAGSTPDAPVSDYVGPSSEPVPVGSDTVGTTPDTPDTGGYTGGGGTGPDTSVGDAKGNASANNGKGGNYDKTGHKDNGKGNGKGRRDG